MRIRVRGAWARPLVGLLLALGLLAGTVVESSAAKLSCDNAGWDNASWDCLVKHPSK